MMKRTSTLEGCAAMLVEAAQLLRQQQPVRDTSGDLKQLLQLLRTPVGQAK